MSTDTTQTRTNDRPVPPEERVLQLATAAWSSSYGMRLLARDSMDHEQQLAARRAECSYSMRALDLVRTLPDLTGAFRILAEAELQARRGRGAILAEMQERSGLYGGSLVAYGGLDVEAELVAEGRSRNGGRAYTKRSLALLREVFEGASFSVCRHRTLDVFDHRGADYPPWPDPERDEAGFVHGLEVVHRDGRALLRGSLHVYEAEVEVRALIAGRLASGGALGLSVETPGRTATAAEQEAAAADPTAIEPVRLTVWAGDEDDGERLPAAALVDCPAAGGRILTSRPAGDREVPEAERFRVRTDGGPGHLTSYLTDLAGEPIREAMNLTALRFDGEVARVDLNPKAGEARRRRA